MKKLTHRILEQLPPPVPNSDSKIDQLTAKIKQLRSLKDDYSEKIYMANKKMDIIQKQLEKLDGDSPKYEKLKAQMKDIRNKIQPAVQKEDEL